LTSRVLIKLLSWLPLHGRSLKNGRLSPYYRVLTSELELVQTAYFSHKALLGKDKSLSTRVHVLSALLYSIQSNAYALGTLINRRFINEAYILIRALYERCLNYCYLIAAPEDELVRWGEYSLQKNIRLLRKELVVGNFGMRLEFGAFREIWDRPQVAEIMKKYQRKVSGKETHNWSKLTSGRLQRIEWLSKNQTEIPWEPFVLAEMMFFDEASEAVHGTFYGTVFHKGFFEPEFQERGELTKEQDPSSLLVGASIIILNSALIAAHQRYPAQDLVDRSVRNTHEIASLFKAEIPKVDVSDINPKKRILRMIVPKEPSNSR
jgi:hypothetical protein